MKTKKFLLFFISAIFMLVGFQSFALADNGNIEEIKKDVDVKKIIFLDTSIDVSHSQAKQFLMKEINFMLQYNLLSKGYAIFDSKSKSKFDKLIKNHPEWEFYILSTNIKLIYGVKITKDYGNILNIFVPKAKKYTQYVYNKKVYIQAIVLNSLLVYSDELILEKPKDKSVLFMEKIDDSFEQIIIGSSYPSSIDISTLNWIRDKVGEKVNLNLDKIFN